MAQAIERNQHALYRLLVSHEPGSVCERRHGALLTSVPFPHPLFNFVSLSEIQMGEESDAIAAAADFFREWRMPWEWQVGPSCEPHDLREKLAKAGFTHSHDAPGMAIDLRSVDTTSPVPVAEARDDAGMDRWIEALLAGFKMPAPVGEIFRRLQAGLGWEHSPCRYFYAEDGGIPVAVSMTYYGAGVAGIYCVATVEAHRRKGLGERVTRASLHAAIEDGYDAAILQSSVMGVPLYLKIGFREYCRLSYFTPP